MWQRWNQSSHIFEKSTDDGGTWVALPLDGSIISEGTVAPARLGSGSSITTKFLRGDSTWQTNTADVSAAGNNAFTGTNSFAALVTLLGGQLKFPATQNPSSDANTLDDYEEGTWTPSDGSGAGLALSVSSATYIKIGKLVIAQAQLSYPATGSGSNSKISGLPFTAGTPNYPLLLGYNDSGTIIAGFISGSTTDLLVYGSGTGARRTNAQLAGSTMVFLVAYLASA